LNDASIARSFSEDSLAAEISKSWSSTRESVLVVVSPPAVEVVDVDDSVQQNNSAFSPVSSNDSESDSHTEVEVFEESIKEEEHVELVKENNVGNVDDEPYDAISGEFPTHNASEEFATSYTTTGRSSFTSLGSDHFQRSTGDTDSVSEEGNVHFSLQAEDKMPRSPSIITAADNKAHIILELGAGVIGIPDLSLSYLHTIATPNPYSYCCNERDSSLESMEL